MSLFLGGALFGCDEPVAGEGQALKVALAQAERSALDTHLDLARLGEPEAWGRLLRRSFARHGARLGNLRFTVDVAYELRGAAGQSLKLTEQRTSDSGLNGDFSLDQRMAWVLPDESGEGGRRCWRVGGQLYSARATGPASHFRERGGEGARCLDAAIEPLQSWLLAFEGVLRLEAVPGVGRLGREVVDVEVSGHVDPSAAPMGLPLFWQENAAHTGTEETMGVPGPRTWLSVSHGALRSLSGALVLDTETGLPLEGLLEIRLAVDKSGQAGEIRLNVRLRTELRSGAIVPPAEIVESGPRPRPFLERERLLGQKFKGAPAAALPRPGDAPPLSLVPGAEGEPAMAVSAPPIAPVQP